MIIHSNGPETPPANGAGAASVLAPVGETGPETEGKVGNGSPVQGFARVFARLMKGVPSPSPKEADTDVTAETSPEVEAVVDEEGHPEIPENGPMPISTMVRPEQPSMPAAPDNAPETSTPPVPGTRMVARAVPAAMAKGGFQHPVAGAETSMSGNADGQGVQANVRADPGLVAGGATRGDANGVNGTGGAPQSAVAEGRQMATQAGLSPVGLVPQLPPTGMRAGSNTGTAPDFPNRTATLAETPPDLPVVEPGRRVRAPTSSAGVDLATAVVRAGVQDRPSTRQTEPARVTARAWDMQAPLAPAPAASDAVANRASPLATSASAISESAGEAAFDPAGIDTSHGADVVRSDRPGPATAQGSPAHGALNAPARAITPQIAAAVQASGERSVEIVLSPAELGKVRITLSPGEAGMAVSIVADRPETLDLLRRHANLLAQDFRELGYGGTEFSFDSGGGSTGQGRDTAPVMAPAEGDLALPGTVQEDAPRHRQMPDRLAPDGRMDIRL